MARRYDVGDYVLITSGSFRGCGGAVNAVKRKRGRTTIYTVEAEYLCNCCGAEKTKDVEMTAAQLAVYDLSKSAAEQLFNMNDLTVGDLRITLRQSETGR